VLVTTAILLPWYNAKCNIYIYYNIILRAVYTSKNHDLEKRTVMVGRHQHDLFRRDDAAVADLYRAYNTII